MKCPSCPETTLVMAERQGVEIDYCPSCRGIWLDRGELDKLLERAVFASAPAPALVSQSRKQPDFEDSDFRSGQRYQQGRKKSWLSEIFD
ncbi:MAG: zf-TFIIB domain-containing protein [Burkholderiales bacterium]|nr:zf-TFIIB domain-containing protein [Burkholderiales bacterium]